MSIHRLGTTLLLLVASSALVPVALSSRPVAPGTPASSPAPVTTPRLERVHVDIPQQPLAVYAHLATEVVHARVLDTSAHVPSVGAAYTAVRLQVLGALKGSSAAEITVKVGGAASPERIVEVVGAPRFTAGEEVVLFLWTEPTTGETGILGLDQGTYRVRATADGVRRVSGVHADAEPLASFLDRLGDELTRPAPWQR